VTDRLIRVWFLLQGLAIIAWWLLLATVPDARPWFFLRDAPAAAFVALAPGDLALAAVGSLAIAIVRAGPVRVALAWVVTGAVTYATCYAVSTAILGLTHPMGALLMSPATIGTLLAALRIQRTDRTDRAPLSHTPTPRDIAAHEATAARDR
jgi:hypothetical protein